MKPRDEPLKVVPNPEELSLTSTFTKDTEGLKTSMALEPTRWDSGVYCGVLRFLFAIIEKGFGLLVFHMAQ